MTAGTPGAGCWKRAAGALRGACLLPLHVVQVFSWAKSFRRNPVLGSLVLNALGLHVFRVLASHGLYRFRLWLLAPLLPASDRRQWLANGFLLKRDFLPAAEFAALRAELLAYRGPVRELAEGSTRTQRVFLDRAARAGLPECRALARNPRLDRILRYASSKNRRPLYYAENLVLGAGGPGRDDPQQDLHADTFHPCVKAWLYVDDVTRGNAPFVFVPGSHRLTFRRLAWEYRESLAASRARSGAAPGRYWDGSFRLAGRQPEDLGYPAPVAFEVPANTLLVANVRGFHRRGDAAGAGTRMTVWMQARDNPFNPLFSPFPELTGRAFENVWSACLKRIDARLARGGLLAKVEGGFERL
jgi:hypothetical protein